MGKLLRRAVMTSVATVGIFGLAVGQASAHFCFKENLNEKAAQKIGKSANWVSFGDLAFEFTGLCPEGIEILAEGGGVTTSTMINTHGTMAGGTLKKGPDAGTKSISYIDFAGLEAAEDDAIAACE
jgi:hypothetical protein